MPKQSTDRRYPRSRRKHDDKKRTLLDDLDNLDDLIEEITVDAYGDDEKLWAFRQAFEDHVTVPCDGFVIGELVSLIEFDYDGNERRGLTARCRREDGSEHVVAASDVVVPQRSRGDSLHRSVSQVAGLGTVLSRARCRASQTRHKGRCDNQYAFADR